MSTVFQTVCNTEKTVREKSVKSQSISFQTKSAHPVFWLKNKKTNLLLRNILWGPANRVSRLCEFAMTAGVRYVLNILTWYLHVYVLYTSE